jgi:hypothetical protein
MRIVKNAFLYWAFGNPLENANRGKLAEYIVATALGLESEPRREWDFADLQYDNVTIEVKSSAYLQTWPQDRPSKIAFDIAPRKQRWNAITNEMTTLSSPGRLADVYVFCIFKEQDPAKADPLDTNQWTFFVASRRVLDEKLGPQKSAALSTIESLSDSASFADLGKSIASFTNSL